MVEIIGGEKEPTLPEILKALTEGVLDLKNKYHELDNRLMKMEKKAEGTEG
jgi:hypothetical protein